MLAAVLPVRSLLLAIFMLMAGSGFLATLISFRLERVGLSAPTIGFVATAYFAGLTLGSLRVSRLIARVGHIRAFAAFVSIYSASTLAYAVHRDVAFWATLRFVDGFAMAGVFICLESWLNERAEQTSRGVVLASYMIALYSGQAIGQFLLNLSDTKPSLPFMAAAILLSLALLPVALTRIKQPEIEEPLPLSVRKLYAVSPLGVAGVASNGMMLGALYGLGAVFARKLGMDVAGTAVFMSFTILGGILLQWPLGKLSDLLDRRTVIIASFGATCLVSIFMALTSTPGTLLLVAGLTFGGLSFALYPLCVAHTNDHLRPTDRISASGGLVLTYSIGAATGPLLASAAIALWGAGGLFMFIGACALALTIFGLWRQLVGVPVPSPAQHAFQTLPRTTPMAAALDPQATNR